MSADTGQPGRPDDQGAESHAMGLWQGSTSAQVQENTKRLDAINGQIDKIERSQDLMRSDVRSLGEKLDGLVASQSTLVASSAGIDWKTVLAVVTGVSTPIAVAIILAGGPLS